MNFRHFPKGSPEYVYYQGIAREKFGKKPIAQLSVFEGIKDKTLTFTIASFLVKEKDDDSVLLGRPFLRSSIDWGQEYQKHLLGPHADIPFSPTEGIENCNCRDCFYRDVPKKSNPERDCQLGEKGDLAKIFFGIPTDVFLPPFIEGKNVGNYCPSYLNCDAD